MSKQPKPEHSLQDYYFRVQAQGNNVIRFRNLKNVERYLQDYTTALTYVKLYNPLVKTGVFESDSVKVQALPMEAPTVGYEGEYRIVKKINLVDE